MKDRAVTGKHGNLTGHSQSACVTALRSSRDERSPGLQPGPCALGAAQRALCPTSTAAPPGLAMDPGLSKPPEVAAGFTAL